MPRYFTVEEANQVVRQIRPLLGEILKIRLKVLEKRPELIPILQKARGNGGGPIASEVVEDFRRLEALIASIQAQGAIVKDINHGLIDFPHWRDGREVYLCWQFGEDEIRYWHEIDAGFAGRQPL
ncbi:MAG: DUF2203 domain-containing protein [Anaerolineales bacterium]|nr:DUF2203 domain-containing protein [Anaerolineales bacterium]MCS7248266.1 DUF2203 domain-containing protein [Anaerolineales bacterium]MDW8162080.1 DUF2203 domain-containing protein [Anaerolineales bacterium]MDW8446230.1 DUF2203 domain-containing protein [Anaerolineales bacterium]